MESMGSLSAVAALRLPVNVRGAGSAGRSTSSSRLPAGRRSASSSGAPTSRSASCPSRRRSCGPTRSRSRRRSCCSRMSASMRSAVSRSARCSPARWRATTVRSVRSAISGSPPAVACSSSSWAGRAGQATDAHPRVGCDRCADPRVGRVGTLAGPMDAPVRSRAHAAARPPELGAAREVLRRRRRRLRRQPRRLHAAPPLPALHYLAAATCSFLVAVTSNYTWNRSGRSATGARASPRRDALLRHLRRLPRRQPRSCCACSSCSAPGSSSARRSRSSSSPRSTSSATSSGRSGARSAGLLRAASLSAVRAVTLAVADLRARLAPRRRRDDLDRAGVRRAGPSRPDAVRAAAERRPTRRRQSALALFNAIRRSRDWLARYPRRRRALDDETYDAKTRSWTVKIWWGNAGEIAEGTVDDASGVVTEAWTGPQVAWKMGRGYKGAFGGVKINDPWIWGAFCLVFFVGLADLRRPLSLRNLDLADAALADRVALVLQPRRHLHGGAALLSRAALGRRARHLDRRHRTRLAVTAAVARLAAARRRRVPHGLPRSG